MSGQGNPRRLRVAQAMRDLLAEMIDRDVKDPRVRAAGLASVNHVELNRDMSVARVHVSFVGPADDSARVRDRALAGLAAAAGFLRGPVARALGLRHAPELRFLYDDSPSFAQRIGVLVSEDSRAAQGAGDAGATPGGASEPAASEPAASEPARDAGPGGAEAGDDVARSPEQHE